jgi:hypothetical protein
MSGELVLEVTQAFVVPVQASIGEGIFEGLERRILRGVDAIRSDWGRGEVDHRGFPCLDVFLDFFHGAARCDAGRAAQSGPEHRHEQIRFLENLAIDDGLGRSPVAGVLCVSHPTGIKTMRLSLAWMVFHSVMTSRAMMRS